MVLCSRYQQGQSSPAGTKDKHMSANVIQTYLTENAKWLNESSAAAIERIPTAAWPAVIEGVETLVGGKEPGIDCGVVITHETLQDFDAARQNHWKNKGTRTARLIEGLTCLHFERFQLRAGDTRRSQFVIDAGDLRICLIG